MGFREFLQGKDRSKDRDNICARLQALGIEAQMAGRGRPEEKIGERSSLGIFDISLGLIDILEEPIRWINVRRVTSHNIGGEGYSTEYYTNYGIPDPKLEQDFQKKGDSRDFSSRMRTASGVFPDALRSDRFDRLKIKSVRKKAFPLFGRVVDLQWRGDDRDLGIIDRLNGDILLKHPIMKSRDVEIRAHSDHGCWTIETKAKNPPSEKLWNCYQVIAKHLLA